MAQAKTSSRTLSPEFRGMGPGVAEIGEPVVVFMADKTSLGAWNLPLFQIYANPFNTAGLVIDPAMHKGFRI